ncbi:MAG: hypothetical protein Q7S40_25020 [Opitutaceae bacterium]|nr:hypothetical protein [Opitutaceae bacterium]
MITPPAVQDGSNGSRAPLPAARPADDINPPNGLAIDDNVPPNTRATNIERAPEARVAIMQPAPASTVTVLTPTGRSTTGVAAALNATQLETTLSSADFSAHTQLISDIEAAMKTAEGAMRGVRATMSEMSASGRAQFKTADDEVKRAERALRDSLRDARKATQQGWDAARAKLASDFQVYSSALTAIDAAAGVR